MVDDDVNHATRTEIEHIWEHIDVIEETIGITREQEEPDAEQNAEQEEPDADAQ